MLAAYWLERWRDGRTGWHQDQPTQLLLKHWPALDIPPKTHTLVPLCGKSADMLWLAGQECLVRGVEISALAVEQFFVDNQLTQRSHGAADGKHWVAASLEIINADIFDLGVEEFAPCGAVYDRAALIALPADMRERYVREVYGKLPSGCRGLVIAMDYPAGRMQGPPFAVDAAEMHRLFDPEWDVELLERQAIPESRLPAALRGAPDATYNAAYRIVKRFDHAHDTHETHLAA